MSVSAPSLRLVAPSVRTLAPSFARSSSTPRGRGRPTPSCRCRRLHTSSSIAASSSPYPSPSSSGARSPAAPPPNAPRSQVRALALVGVLAAGAYLLGSVYPPETLRLIFPVPAPPRHSIDSNQGRKHMDDIERQLHQLPLVRQLLESRSHVDVEVGSTVKPNGRNRSNAPDANPHTAITAAATRPTRANSPSEAPGNTDARKADEVGGEGDGRQQMVESGDGGAHYLMSRPYARFPPSKAQHSLTAGGLRGPGLFAVPPLVMSLTPHGARTLGGHEGDAYAFLHLGRSMCGHDGIIHGGLLATVCDETLARTAFYSLPHHIGVTAHLELDYRAPCKADQFVVVRTEKVESKGRKAVVRGEIRDLDGKLLVEAKAIFVEPRMAALLLNQETIQQVMDIDGSGAKRMAAEVAKGERQV